MNRWEPKPPCDHHCKECGKHETGSWMGTLNEELAAAALCFHCKFWMDYVNFPEHEDGRRFIVNGSHYFANYGTDHKGGMLGFGGRLFQFVLPDGSIFESNNVWHQGKIPDHFRDRLPDNATFLRDQQWTEINGTKYLLDAVS